MSGAVRLGVADREWLLPPAFAAWIPAGTPIAFEMPHPVTSCSVLFVPGFAEDVSPPLPADTTVFAMDVLAREMVRHARRWGPDGDGYGAEAATFFRALAGVIAGLGRRPADVWRPVTSDPALRAAIAFTEAEHGREIVVADAARSAGLTERTLLRRYASELGMTWAQSLRRIRMIAAMERLVTTRDPITSVALDVGYQSLSAFNTAFRDFAGATPSAIRSGPDAR